MPPKPEKKKTNTKEHAKKMQKVVEDKTFGLKNKKGAKMQKYIQQLQNQVQPNKQQMQAKKKKDEEDDLKDLSKIFKPVQDMPKLAADVDPKSVLCVFFKQGLCTKGKKCKFSHDLSVQQKTAKRNLYVDSRDLKKDDDETAKETNENWDETQLNEVAEKKHGDKDRKRPNQTDIVCKFFLNAIEENKYGWFWECPNGEKCIYRHALPPGYVLAKDKKKMDEQKRLEQISLEELIEKERSKLSTKNQTQVSLETFIAWKKKKLREKRKKEAEEATKKQTDFKSGRQPRLTGRELFTYNLQTTEEDDDEGGATFIREKEQDNPDDVKAFEIDARTFMNIGAEGQMIDDLDDEEEPTSADQPGPSKPVVFDESVFKDEDMGNLSDLDDDDGSEEDDDQSEAGIEDEIQSKLKV